MIYGLFLVTLICAFLFVTILLQKAELFKVITFGSAMFFSFYIIASGLLIWIDKFDILKTLMISFALEFFCVLCIILVEKKRIKSIVASPVISAISIGLVLAFGFLSEMNKEGLYPAGQDQGLYQFKAILYISGDYRNINSFDEYEFLNGDEEKFKYFKLLKDMVGVELIKSPTSPIPDYYGPPEITINDVNVNDEGMTDYILHGIATFPALLALWGKMFGITNMTGILTVIYVISILGVWFICDNLGLKKTSSTVAAIIYGLCPIVLWCSTVTLTEVGLGLILILFLGIVTEKRKKKIYFWSIIPVSAFCFYHILIITMLPFFIIFYFLMYLFTSGKKILVAMCIVAFSYICGINMMNTYNEQYLQKNTWTLVAKTGGLMNFDNYMYIYSLWPIIVVFFLLVIALILKRTGLKSKFLKSLKIKTNKGTIWARIFVVCMIVIFTVLAILTYKRVIVEDVAPSHFAFFGIEAVTGYFILPLAILYIIFFVKDYFKDIRKLSLVSSFFYFILVYAILMRPDIDYYYYYFRYYEPYMVITIVLGMMLLDKIGGCFTIVIGVASVWLMISQNQLLFRLPDRTYADFTSLESIASCVGKRDVVLMKDDEYTVTDLFMIPIKAVTGATIFLYDEDNIDNQLDELGGMYDNIFCLTYDYSHGDDEASCWKHVYQEMCHGSGYDGDVDGYPPYPVESVTWDASVGLFIYTGKGY